MCQTRPAFLYTYDAGRSTITLTTITTTATIFRYTLTRTRSFLLLLRLWVDLYILHSFLASVLLQKRNKNRLLFFIVMVCFFFSSFFANKAAIYTHFGLLTARRVAIVLSRMSNLEPLESINEFRNIRVHCLPELVAFRSDFDRLTTTSCQKPYIS